MKIQTGQINGRTGWKLNNELLSVFLMAGGGHIGSLELKSCPGVNPFWIPHWKAIEPWRYCSSDAKKYESKLLACISGHNICLSAFGDPSEEENRAGFGCHGEAPVVRWHCKRKKVTKNQLTFTYGCLLPIAQMEYVRTVILQAGLSIIRIKETVNNLSRHDVPFTMCQHVTFGRPFLEPGITRFDASAKKGHTYPGVFAKSHRLKPDTAFSWPYAPGKKGKVDLRFDAKSANSDFSTNLMDTRLSHAWLSALNPDLGLLIAYVWSRADYPWLGIWQERFARKQKPWVAKSYTRGMEFSNTPFPIGLRKSVDIGRFQGQPTFRWLPAQSRLNFDYSILAMPVKNSCKGVQTISPSNSGFKVSLIN